MTEEVASSIKVKERDNVMPLMVLCTTMTLWLTPNLACIFSQEFFLKKEYDKWKYLNPYSYKLQWVPNNFWNFLRHQMHYTKRVRKINQFVIIRLPTKFNPNHNGMNFYISNIEQIHTTIKDKLKVSLKISNQSIIVRFTRIS
jgi:hypothetical protein